MFQLLKNEYLNDSNSQTVKFVITLCLTVSATAGAKLKTVTSPKNTVCVLLMSLNFDQQKIKMNIAVFLFLGNEVVIVKNGRRICGAGACLANAPIMQDKAYFEIKVQSTG